MDTSFNIHYDVLMDRNNSILKSVSTNPSISDTIIQFQDEPLLEHNYNITLPKYDTKKIKINTMQHCVLTIITFTIVICLLVLMILFVLYLLTNY